MVRQGYVTIATHNARTMAVNGTQGPGESKDMLASFSELAVSIICTQETLSDGVLSLSQERYVVYCRGTKAGRNCGYGGVGLGANEDIVRQGTRNQAGIDARALEAS